MVMTPRKSSADAWKYVKKDGADIEWLLCEKIFTGSLTREVDHLLGITNGNGGGVEQCPTISEEQKTSVERDFYKSTAERGHGKMKSPRVQGEIYVSCSTPIPSFTSNNGDSSVSVPTKTSRTVTLKSIWKPVEKQQVDDAIA